MAAEDLEVNGQRLLLGDCLERLKDIPENSIQLVCTSPPYYQLRDYNTGKWEGGNDPHCDHVKSVKPPTVSSSSTLGYPTDGGPRRIGEKNTYHEAYTEHFKQVCKKCGARRVDLQIGGEFRHDCNGWATGERCGACFVCVLVKVFRRVRRVLRADGILVLNLGDSYVSNPSKGKSGKGKNSEYLGGVEETLQTRRRPGAGKVAGRQANRNGDAVPGLPSKNLLCVPWRVALALQADGWILRSALPWCARSKMPESVTDRPGNGLEYVFIFAKQSTYYWDAEAIKQRATYSGSTERPPTTGAAKRAALGDLARTTPVGRTCGGDGKSRNFRNSDLWFQSVDTPHGLTGIDDELVGLDVTSEGLSARHFASFPTALVRPFILAGSSPKCCADCGKCWRRVVSKERKPTRPGHGSKVPGHEGKEAGNRDPLRHCTETTTTGWRPDCECHGKLVQRKIKVGRRIVDSASHKDGERLATSMHSNKTTLRLASKQTHEEEVEKTITEYVSDLPLDEHPTAKSIILDPFAGAYTVALVAMRHGRNSIGIELNPEYLKLGEKRLRQRGRLGRGNSDNKGKGKPKGFFGSNMP